MAEKDKDLIKNITKRKTPHKKQKTMHFKEYKGTDCSSLEYTSYTLQHFLQDIAD